MSFREKKVFQVFQVSLESQALWYVDHLYNLFFVNCAFSEDFLNLFVSNKMPENLYVLKCIWSRDHLFHYQAKHVKVSSLSRALDKELYWRKKRRVREFVGTTFMNFPGHGVE